MRELSRTAAVFTAFLVFTSWALGAQQPDPLFQEAGAAYKAGQFRKAGDLFAQFSFLFPQDPRSDDADFLGATAWIQGGEAQKGLEALRRHARVHPESAYLSSASYWTGRAWFLLEKWDLAASAFQAQTSSGAPEDLGAQSRYWWGLSLLRLDRKNEAEEVWLKADSQTLWGQRSRLQAALLLLDREKTAEAQVLLGRLRQENLPKEILHGVLFYLTQAAFESGDHGIVLGRTDDFFQNFPQDAQELPLRYLRGQSLRKLGREEEAVAQFRLCLTSGSPDLILRASFDLGDIYHKAGRWSESLALWAGLGEGDLTADQKQKRAANAAQAAFRLQRWDEARTWYLKAWVGPDRALSGESLIGAASSAFLGKKPGEAVRHLEAYLKDFSVAPRREETALILLKTAIVREDRDRALNLLDLLIKEFPGSKETLERRLERSRFLTEKGDYAPALEDVQFLLDRNPPRSILGEALYQGAYIYALRAEPLRGEKYLYRLVEEFPQGELRDRALLARGLAFFNAGQMEPAAASLNRLLRESPGSVHEPQAWLNLAALHERGGRAGESASAYQRAAELLSGELRIQTLIKAGLQKGRTDPQGALNLWISLESEAVDTDLPKIRLLKARTLLELKKEEEARKLLDGILNSRGTPGPTQENWEEGARVLSGLLIQKKEDLSGLLGSWKRKYPQSTLRLEVLLSHADSLLKAGRFPEAAAAAEELLALGKDNVLAETYRLREALAVAEGDLVKARELFQKYFTLHGQTGAALGASRSLAALLVRQNRESELDYWIREIPSLTPLTSVITELHLGKGKLILDTRWEEGVAILEKILRTAATGNQKSEALVLLCEGAVRNSQFSSLKDWIKLLPPGTDPLFRARARMAEAQAALAQGGNTGALETLVRDSSLPEDYRAQGLYHLWKYRDANQDSRAAETAKELKIGYPKSSWAALVPQG